MFHEIAVSRLLKSWATPAYQLTEGFHLLRLAQALLEMVRLSVKSRVILANPSKRRVHQVSFGEFAIGGAVVAANHLPSRQRRIQVYCERIGL